MMETRQKLTDLFNGSLIAKELFEIGSTYTRTQIITKCKNKHHIVGGAGLDRNRLETIPITPNDLNIYHFSFDGAVWTHTRKSKAYQWQRDLLKAEVYE